MMPNFNTRRSDYDVSNSIQVSDPGAVATAVQVIYADLYPHAALGPLQKAFADFTRMYRGEDPRFHGCETTYHDLQHSLDVTLALARHIDGYERSQRASQRLGPKRAVVGIITALFHDVGYLRSVRDRRHQHGAEYTLTHVSRGGEFLNDYLASLGLGSEATVASHMIHYTGYERNINAIRLGDDLYTRLGHLLGTADLTAQMADRCYLEKCRDRLYAEFVMGGMARRTLPSGQVVVIYSSPQDLLQKTPDFYAKTLRDRLDGTFAGAYRFAANHFRGDNLYMESIHHNFQHLDRVLRSNDWELLRRTPPCFTAENLRAAANTPLRATKPAAQHQAHSV